MAAHVAPRQATLLHGREDRALNGGDIGEATAGGLVCDAIEDGGEAGDGNGDDDERALLFGARQRLGERAGDIEALLAGLLGAGRGAVIAKNGVPGGVQIPKE